MAYRLQPKARTDIRAIISYIGQHNPHAALTWQDSMTELFELLATHPHSGVPYATDKYSVRIVPRGNYVVVYRVRDSGVVILRVIHAARDWPKQMR